MNHLPLSMTNVLFGTLAASPDPGAIGDRYRAAGGDPERLVVLRGRPGIEALQTPAAGDSRVSRWARQMYRVCDTIAAHIVDTAVGDLEDGNTVLVVRHVESRDANDEGQRLLRLGASHLHYSGRWTSVEHGTLPAPRTTSMSTAR